jgi:hypothetical protein
MMTTLQIERLQGVVRAELDAREQRKWTWAVWIVTGIVTGVLFAIGAR